MNRPIAMEKKILVALTLLAGVSLLWVFQFLGREGVENDFMRQTELQMDGANNSESTVPLDLSLDYLRPGFAVHRKQQTNYVLREGDGVARGVDKVVLTVEKPTQPLPAVTSCEQKRIKNLQNTEPPRFCIQSLQVQPSKEWPNEYEVIFQRLRGNWSDLEAAVHSAQGTKVWSEIYSPQQTQVPSI